MRKNSRDLAKDPESKRIFQKGGAFYDVGETLAQPELAQTLERIAKNGPTVWDAVISSLTRPPRFRRRSPRGRAARCRTCSRARAMTFEHIELETGSPIARSTSMARIVASCSCPYAS